MSSQPPQRRVHEDVPAALDRFDITGALETIWDYVRGLNRYVEQTKPWELAKDPEREADLDRALFELADGLRIAAVALSPYLPETATSILTALGQSTDVVVGAGRIRPDRRRPPGSRRRSRSSRASTRLPSRDRHPRAPRCARGCGRRARPGARGRSEPRDHDRHRARLVPGRARAGRGQRRRLRRARHRPPPGGKRRGASCPRAARAARQRACGRRGGDRSRLPLRRRDEGRAAATLRGAARAGARAQASGRDPYARGERRHRVDAPRARGHGRHALLLRAGSPCGRARARLVLLLRRQRHLPEGRGAA